MSNDDFITILQNPCELKSCLKENTYIFYKNNSSVFLETRLLGLGRVFSENLSLNYYQYSTGVVQVLSLKQEGTFICSGRLQSVHPKDILI